MHTSTLGVACTERTNTTTVRTSFNGGGANTALAATMLRSTKRSTQLRPYVNNPGGRLQPCCIFIVIVSSSYHLLFHRCLIAFYDHHRLQHTSIISSQLHRVLRLLEYQFSYFFISSFIVFCVYDYYYCWRFIASRRHRLLVHRNVVKRHQHQAHLLPTADNLSIGNQLLEGTCSRGVSYRSSKEGSTWSRPRQLQYLHQHRANHFYSRGH